MEIKLLTTTGPKHFLNWSVALLLRYPSYCLRPISWLIASININSVWHSTISDCSCDDKDVSKVINESMTGRIADAGFGGSLLRSQSNACSAAFFRFFFWFPFAKGRGIPARPHRAAVVGKSKVPVTMSFSLCHCRAFSIDFTCWSAVVNALRGNSMMARSNKATAVMSSPSS